MLRFMEDIMNKSIRSIATLLAAAGIVALGPVAAGAVETSADSPIALNATIARAAGFFPGTTYVSFKNLSDTVATRVVFALEANGAYAGQFEDVGTFTKGATINHEFPNPSAAFDQSVAVAKVTFSDGSVWQNAALSAAHPVRQAASPLSLSGLP